MSGVSIGSDVGILSEEPLEGALLVDKPAGMTSAHVLRCLKRSLSLASHGRRERIGHSGTLDPMATGLLVVLLGKATRLQDVVLESTKTYVGEIALGVETDRFADSTGTLTGI